MRIHATGRKVYVVQTRGPTGPKRVTLGLHGELSTDEARKRAGTVIGRIKRGEEPVPAPPEPEFTVAALAERFMRVHVQVHCKPRTVTTYRSVLDGHILPALGATAISAVGPSDIAALHHRLRDTPGTANGAVRVVSAMFRLAEAWELVAPRRNPCRSVRLYKQRSCERFLTPDEYRRLGRALREAQADGSVSPAVVAAIRLLGVYTVNASSMEIWLMTIFGAIGYVLRKLGFDVAPLLLAVVLGDRMELAFRRSLTISNGDFSIFVDSTTSKVLLGAVIVVVAVQGIAWYLGWRGRSVRPDD